MDIAAVRKILECPVCLEVRQGTKMFVCLVGHKICSPCLDDPSIGAANKCPECKGGYRTQATTNDNDDSDNESDKVTLPTRNLDVEAIIENLGKKIVSPCKYSRRGCEFTGIKGPILRHQEVCPHRKVPCPMEGSCQDLQLSDLMDHMKTSHGMTSFVGKTVKLGLHKYSYLSRYITCNPKMMSFHNLNFLAFFKTVSGAFHTWVVLPLDKTEAEKYIVTVEASGNGCKFKLPCKVHWADRPTREILADEKNVFTMEEKNVKRFMVENPDATDKEIKPFVLGLTYNVRRKVSLRKRKMKEEGDDDNSSEEDNEPQSKLVGVRA